MTSFTAEEIWKQMKHVKEENVESPMLTKYPVPNEQWDNKELAEKWEKIIDLKNKVSKELELSRAEKVIGNALDALVTIKAPKEEYRFLKENEKLIRDVLIVSQLELEEAKELEIKVEHAKGEKCQRCWQYSTEIKDGLCPRCYQYNSLIVRKYFCM